MVSCRRDSDCPMLVNKALLGKSYLICLYTASGWLQTTIAAKTGSSDRRNPNTLGSLLEKLPIPFPPQVDQFQECPTTLWFPTYFLNGACLGAGVWLRGRTCAWHA
jgi:hypothetical protein